MKGLILTLGVIIGLLTIGFLCYWAWGVLISPEALTAADKVLVALAGSSLSTVLVKIVS